MAQWWEQGDIRWGNGAEVVREKRKNWRWRVRERMEREETGHDGVRDKQRRDVGSDTPTLELRTTVARGGERERERDSDVRAISWCRSHEIVGVVTEVGNKVEKFKVGDRVGVGCLVGSCGTCASCDKSFENNCAKWVLTYGSIDHDGAITYGGYSDTLVAPERYVFRFPDSLPFDKGAPLLCAGITVYSPMKHFGLNEPGKHLGVVGLGGLGHVAIRFAKAFGMKVTVISTSPGKEREAIDNFGADAFLLSKNTDQMKAAVGTMDGIIDTVSAVHPLGPLFGLLKSEGTLILVGAPDKPLEIAPFSLIRGGKKLAGSCIGGMRDTQEMLDFAAKHGITADVEVIPIDYVNTAMERLVRNDVRFRFVIDVANTLKAAA